MVERKPVLVPTDVAVTYIVKCRRQVGTDYERKAAREHIYYLAKRGDISRHGVPKRGQALWDLWELAEAYRQRRDGMLP